MFEIPSLTLQFVSTAYQNGAQRWKLWCVLFVHGLDMVFTLMHFPLGSNQNGKGCFPDISSERLSACCAFAEF